MKVCARNNILHKLGLSQIANKWEIRHNPFSFMFPILLHLRLAYCTFTSWLVRWSIPWQGSDKKKCKSCFLPFLQCPEVWPLLARKSEFSFLSALPEKGLCETCFLPTCKKNPVLNITKWCTCFHTTGNDLVGVPPTLFGILASPCFCLSCFWILSYCFPIWYANKVTTKFRLMLS